jgi:hypothetical protein
MARKTGEPSPRTIREKRMSPLRLTTRERRVGSCTGIVEAGRKATTAGLRDEETVATDVTI